MLYRQTKSDAEGAWKRFAGASFSVSHPHAKIHLQYSRVNKSRAESSTVSFIVQEEHRTKEEEFHANIKSATPSHRIPRILAFQQLVGFYSMLLYYPYSYTCPSQW